MAALAGNRSSQIGQNVPLLLGELIFGDVRLDGGISVT